MERIVIHTDGGARGNPGPAGIGAVISDENGKVLKEVSAYIGEQTNNYAEYEALIRALVEVKLLFGTKLHDTLVEVMMDSELVVRQLAGIYKVKDAGLKEQFARVEELRASGISNIIFTHVRREANVRADMLVNAALDGHLSIAKV